MWGNRLGWMISAAIAATVGVIIGLLLFVEAAVSPPTAFGLDDRNFGAIELPVAPATVLSATDACDAGAQYRQAMSLANADVDRYRQFAQAGTLASAGPAGLATVEPVLRATSCGGMTLFADRPEQIITYAHENSAADTLLLLGQVCADRLGLLNQKAGRAAEAKKYYEAAFALGAKLYRERVCWAECEAGLSLMGRTAPALASLAEQSGQADRARQLRTFDAARIEYVNERVNPMLRVVRSIDPGVVAEHAGDLFRIIERSPERMWRVEAVLALGRLRYSAGENGRAANQRAAVVKLKELEKNPDPVIRAAAKAARELTVEQFRMQ